MVCVTEIKNEIYIFVYLVFYGNACGSWGIRMEMLAEAGGFEPPVR